jgi:type VI secretion system protein VasD
MTALSGQPPIVAGAPRSSSRLWLVTIVVAIAACEGCALLKKKPVPPPSPPGTVVAPAPGKRTADVAIEAGPELNPDRNRQFKPVLVRVYQLKADAAFRNAQFDALDEDDKKVLGDAFIARHEYTLAPGDSRRLEIPLADETGYIGVVASFHDVESAASQWRAIVPVPRQPLRVTLNGSRVALITSEQVAQP